MKICNVCKTSKEIIYFSKYAKAPDGLQYTCKTCQKAHYKQWKLKNPEYHRRWLLKNKDHVRDKTFKRNFGISLTDYESMFQIQKGLCFICEKTCPTGHKLAVDHCHTTGKIRSLLCLTCNALLGYLENRAIPIEKYLNYIEMHKLKKNERGT